jgi:hypothetical protein
VPPQGQAPIPHRTHQVDGGVQVGVGAFGCEAMVLTLAAAAQAEMQRPHPLGVTCLQPRGTHDCCGSHQVMHPHHTGCAVCMGQLSRQSQSGSGPELDAIHGRVNDSGAGRS